MRDFFVKSLSFLKWVFFLLLIVVLSVYFILRGSLPNLDGQKTMTLLEQSVQIERDRQGIPTIRSKSRADTAFALGYVHAQERFFQMDLLRRRAAGELSGLFGDAALENDVLASTHRFKDRARQLLRRLPKAHYTVLQSYANGVNSGIESLRNEPYQYLLLQQKPKPWEAKDSLLCIYAMYFDLNDELGVRETSLAILRTQLPPPWFEFLTPKGGIWDAPMDGRKLPDSETIRAIPQLPLPETFSKQFQQMSAAYPQQALSDSHFLPGSNSWAIDASLTPYSSSMLASDMHLTLRVPNIWYRASWYLRDGRRVTGVTLPGVPAMVVGSNEKIAWGFTNSYGDWGDIITLKTNAKGTQYLTAEGWQNFTIYNQSVMSHTGKSKEQITIETIWGPVIGKNHNGEMIVHQWVGYAPQAVNLSLLDLEGAFSTKEALKIAPNMGLPPQNMMLADHEGHIAWTIAGAIPRRESQAVPGQVRRYGWAGYQAATDYPVFIEPDKHRIWSANNRVISGNKLAMVGFEGGDLGARAQQIRDALLAKEQFQETDLLAMQLDSRALFLQRWKQLLSASIADSNEASLVFMTEVLNGEPDLAAQPDSVAYGLVRAFRNIVVNQTIGWIYDVLEKNHPRLFKRSSVDNLIEYPVWELVSKQPQHLLPAGYASWDEFLLAATRQAYNEITRNGEKLLQQQTWGTQHSIAISHPLSAALPGLGVFLDMPVSPLSGDVNMPKVLGSNFGASMRMVVAPGQEEKGIMHMPAGQSSHPLSAYYSKGHQDWVAGKPSEFLPGKAKWLLELKSIQ